MPDEKGLLSPEEREKCAAWFQQHSSGNVECPICKTSQWEIEDHLVKTHILVPGQRSVEGTPMFSFFLACCRNCRHTLFVNAVDSQVIQNRPPDSAMHS